jgi:DNA-binding transcriptional LysR family regulator
MDWNLVKVFLAISDTGSLTSAAEALGVNHSTVFRRLNALEEMLQGRVFDRMQASYQLTQLGEELLPVASSIAEGFDDLQRQAMGRDIKPRGVVKITAPNNLAYRFLPKFLVSFNQMYPDIQTEILASDLAINMNSRQADIAVRFTAAPPEYLVGRELCSVPWIMCGSKLSIKKWGQPKSFKTLNQFPLIGGSGALSSLPAFKWLDKHMTAQIGKRSDDLYVVARLVEAGAGFAPLPFDLIDASLQPLFNFTHAPPSRLWVLTHPELRGTERIKLMMRHLAAEFASDALIGKACMI